MTPFSDARGSNLGQLCSLDSCAVHDLIEVEGMGMCGGDSDRAGN